MPVVSFMNVVDVWRDPRVAEYAAPLAFVEFRETITNADTFGQT